MGTLYTDYILCQVVCLFALVGAFWRFLFRVFALKCYRKRSYENFLRKFATNIRYNPLRCAAKCYVAIVFFLACYASYNGLQLVLRLSSSVSRSQCFVHCRPSTFFRNITVSCMSVNWDYVLREPTHRFEKAANWRVVLAAFLVPSGFLCRYRC
jgi:hypothetical protein